METSGDLVRFFMAMRDTLKLYHWQTRSYARHKASDELLDRLDTLIDRFVEVFSGRYARPQYGGGFTCKVRELTEDTAERILKRYADYLRDEVPKHLHPDEDTDLLTVRDEMLAAINRASYLFTLH